MLASLVLAVALVAEAGLFVALVLGDGAERERRARREESLAAREALLSAERLVAILDAALAGRRDPSEAERDLRDESVRGRGALARGRAAYPAAGPGPDPGDDAPWAGSERLLATLEARGTRALGRLREGDRGGAERIAGETAPLLGLPELARLRERAALDPAAPSGRPAGAWAAAGLGTSAIGLVALVALAAGLRRRREPPAPPPVPPVPESVKAAAVTSVVAGVAHEMRNPLFGVSAAAQVLRELAGEDPHARRAAEGIATEVRRLDSLLRDLLEYAHPRTGAPQRAPDPEAAVRKAVELEAGGAGAAGVRVEVASTGPPVVVGVAPDRLRQVVANLLTNAVEASSPGATIRVSCCSEGAAPPTAWTLRVWNDAVIPPEVLAHAFDLFYSTKPRGTGLGLPICRRIAEEADGTLTLESAAGSGTTATLRLPAVAETA